MKSDRIAKVKISNQALLALLKLPKDVEILQIDQDTQDFVDQQFTVIVKHPSLKEVPNGCAIPQISVTMSAEFCDACERTHLISGEFNQ